MSRVQQQMQHIASQDHVQGVLVSDVNGLCMCATGTLLPAASAHVQALLEGAARLSDEGEHPTIHLQTGHSDILIQHADGYTTAVARASHFGTDFLQPAPAQHEAAAEEDDEAQQQAEQ